MFSNPGPQTKIGQAMGILLILRFWSGSTKTGLEFLVLVGGFFLYHLNGFIFNHGFNFLGAPFMAYNGLKSKKIHKFDLKSIFNHEGGTQTFWVIAQNKTIQIRFPMI